MFHIEHMLNKPIIPNYHQRHLLFLVGFVCGAIGIQNMFCCTDSASLTVEEYTIVALFFFLFTAIGKYLALTRHTAFKAFYLLCRAGFVFWLSIMTVEYLHTTMPFQILDWSSGGTSLIISCIVVAVVLIADARVAIKQPIDQL